MMVDSKGRTEQETTMSIRKLRAAVNRAGGMLVPDGCGGYDMLAPSGCRWKAVEVWCQPLALGECESPGERHDLVAAAIEWVGDGVEPLQEAGR
jgi:hypothetical protein